MLTGMILLDMPLAMRDGVHPASRKHGKSGTWRAGSAPVVVNVGVMEAELLRVLVDVAAAPLAEDVLGASVLDVGVSVADMEVADHALLGHEPVAGPAAADASAVYLQFLEAGADLSAVTALERVPRWPWCRDRSWWRRYGLRG
jgi:hypothetical protein